MNWWFGTALWKRVLGALVLGVIFGTILTQMFGDAEAAALLETYVKPVGDLFIRRYRCKEFRGRLWRRWYFVVLVFR